MTASPEKRARAWGSRPSTGSSSRAAATLELSQAHGAPIHLLVTDMVMPKMGGRALLEELAVLRPETQMLFISGYSNDAAIRRDGLATTVHFLQKPFEPAILADKIRQVLDHRD